MLRTGRNSAASAGHVALLAAVAAAASCRAAAAPARRRRPMSSSCGRRAPRSAPIEDGGAARRRGGDRSIARARPRSRRPRASLKRGDRRVRRAALRRGVGALDQARELADRTGAAGLTQAQLSDLFLYRGLVQDPAGRRDAVWDELVAAVDDRSGARARSGAVSAAGRERARARAPGARRSQARDARGRRAARLHRADRRRGGERGRLGAAAGRPHWVLVTCADRAPWGARVELTGDQLVVARNTALAPPTDDEVLIQARTAAPRAFVAVEVRSGVGTVRLVGIDGRERDRRSVAVTGDLTPLAGGGARAARAGREAALVPVAVGVGGRCGDRRRGDRDPGHRRDRAEQQSVDVDGQAGLHVAVARSDRRTAGRLARAGLAVALRRLHRQRDRDRAGDRRPDRRQDASAFAARRDRADRRARRQRSRSGVADVRARRRPRAARRAVRRRSRDPHDRLHRRSSDVAYGRTCAIAVSPANRRRAAPVLLARRQVRERSRPRRRRASAGSAITYQGTALLVGGADAGQEPGHRRRALRSADRASSPCSARCGARPARCGRSLGTSPPSVIVVGGDLGGRRRGVRRAARRPRRRPDRRRRDGAHRADRDRADRRPRDRDRRQSAAACRRRARSTRSRRATPVEVRKLAPRSRIPRSGHTATRLGDDVGAPVLVAGGVDATGAPVDDRRAVQAAQRGAREPDDVHAR